LHQGKIVRKLQIVLGKIGRGTTKCVRDSVPGQYYDQETGLHYNGFRYYDPSTGRYLTSDPIGQAGGLNTYSYVFNNPVRYSDPYGLFAPAVPAPIAPPVGGGNGAGSGGIDWSAPFWPKWIRDLFFNEDGNEPTDPPIDPPADDPQQCEDDEERCRKVKNQCIARCSEFGLPSKYGDGVSFRRCVRNCMEREGCFNF
jgi:RHS repeat-associated protein